MSRKKKDNVVKFDTTLRDGEQSPGFSMSIEEKLTLATQLAKLNVDENPKTASQYGIMSIPTLLIFKDGAPVSNIVGFRPKAELQRSLDAVL